MMILGFLVHFVLIITVFLGLFGLFFYKEYVAKIFCLSISYSSFVLLFLVISGANSGYNEAVLILTTILLVFAANLLVGIAIVRKIIVSERK